MFANHFITGIVIVIYWLSLFQYGHWLQPLLSHFTNTFHVFWVITWNKLCIMYFNRALSVVYVENYKLALLSDGAIYGPMSLIACLKGAGYPRSHITPLKSNCQREWSKLCPNLDTHGKWCSLIFNPSHPLTRLWELWLQVWSKVAC